MNGKRDEGYYRAWMSSRQVSRRGLFRGLLGGGKQVRDIADHENHGRAAGRPPQAVAESLFLHLCTGCGECAQACPYGLIEIAGGAARLQIDFSACDTSRCLACTAACQQGALNSHISPDTALRPSIATGCLGRRDDECRLCVYACAKQVLSFNAGGEVLFDESRCDGCGECKTACYHGYISLVAGIPRLTIS
ncbi:4Fe-4S dicluster domain-containing protein [Enterobacillus tribolii]|uniref:Ferredoxin-type protein NapF n=1 Tax=Enterobacillus tribolii TaxID=1487935 RepID=A0A370QMG2_9GAMM|nr:4Fe-4S dicluster domain-containing protein [Enterobacillus tribolii]MBW7982379.1 4Fe-4S dicluster domain-containing protein [Enterobacillus tribolii]RDK89545.1 ferredoxin-type protein NapF [Enterobacillus tribolii]